LQKQSIRMFLNNTYAAYTVAGIFLLFSVLLGTSIGTVYVPITTIIKIMEAKFLGFTTERIDPMFTNIVLDIRLPRVILSGLVGAALAIAGAAFQGLLKNPLADPYTLGVSSGASVGAVFTLYFQISIPFVGSFTLPVVSILFSLMTIFSVLTFARKIERSMRVETIILTGIIFSSFLGAFISLLIALTGDELRQIISWLLGSVSMRGWAYIKIILPFFIFGSVILIMNAKELNVMSFGEERAQHLGVNVQKRKLIILISGSILTGAAVAVSGTIGFVGLVIPHFARLLWGTNHRHLLPLSIFIGGGFLIIADLISRTIISPTEIPIGVITALIGAPVFAIILLKRKKVERSG